MSNSQKPILPPKLLTGDMRGTARDSGKQFWLKRFFKRIIGAEFSELKKQNQELKNRVQQLEESCKKLESNQAHRISDLRKIMAGADWKWGNLEEVPSPEITDPFYPLFGDIRALSTNFSELSAKLNATIASNVQPEAEPPQAEQESNLRAILDNTSDEIYLINRNLELIDYNRTFDLNFQAMFANKPERGKKVIELLPDEYRNLKAKYTERFLRALQGTQRTYIDRIILGSYESIHEVQMFPIRDETGMVTGVSVFSRDCTDQKHSEEIIRTNQELLSSLNHNIKEGLYRSTLYDGLVYVNEAFIELFGYESEEEAKRTATEDFYADANERIKLIEDLKIHGYVTSREVRLRRKDGSVFFALLSTKMSKDNKGNVYLDGAIRDITRIKEYEEEILAARDIAEKATRAKSEFLATMSHEIRTPMNGVIGMTSLLSSTELNEQQRDFVNTIRVSGEHLLNIINDILDFSKIEAGHLELESTAFDLNACIEDVLNLFSGRAAEKNIELLYSIHPNKKHILRGDVTRLRQVIVNLVGNAVKFTDKGEVLIDVKLIPTDDNSVKLSFSVADTGIGIPADKLERLFQPFMQVDNSTTRKYGGTGLGLAISKSLVQLMGGDLKVESAQGKGTRFSFELELIKADEELGNPETELEILKGKSALILDDNHTNVRILEQLLIARGMTVESYNNPLVALGVIQGGKTFDIGLIDMKMPEMDGIEFGKEMAKIAPGRMPLILHSSIGQMMSGTEHTKYFRGHITKPLRHDVLLAKIVEILGEKTESKAPETVKGAPLLGMDLPLKILIVEDNIINQKLAEKVLEMFGYKATVAENGREALEIISENNFDLIFMDVMMPEMDGLEATRRIRAGSQYGNPVIIAMTANALKGDREICIEAGMDDYLSKPINVDEVRNMLIRYGSQVHSKRPHSASRA